MNNAAPNTVIIPAHASVAFPVDIVLNALQLGAGTIIDEATGVRRL
jgi:hypothetical protein